MFKRLIFIMAILALAGIGALTAFAAWGWFYITRDLPEISTLSDYNPPAASTIHAADDIVVAEFFDERRYPTKLRDVPEHVKNAFISAEDSSFYSHPGVDLVSIFRAFIVNLKEGGLSQGGSTITQQVVKNLLLSPEKKIKRKAKEALLSYKLEKSLTKDEILEIYLNQIFFGNTAYGIGAAARVYFGKNIQNITLAEGAMLAGLPKAPSRYSPTKHFQRAKRRQRYVLDQMVSSGFLSKKDANAAFAEDLNIRSFNSPSVFEAPYYVSEVKRVFEESWPQYSLKRDGLRVFTALDRSAYKEAENALKQGLWELDKRRGWRGPIDRAESLEEFVSKYGGKKLEELEIDEPYPAYIDNINSRTGEMVVNLGIDSSKVPLKESEWARRLRTKEDTVIGIKPEESLKPGDIIEVRLRSKEDGYLLLAETPDVEGGAVILNPHTGEVVSLVGGYSYKRSVFNRITQSLRQPGSVFKPVVYLTAVDRFGYTPATIVYDSPRAFRAGDEIWQPGNFDDKFLGPITLRVALEKSRNLVSADIISRIGIDPVIQYAKRLGITSTLGRNLSLSLGSSEASPLELARAFGVFPAKGILSDTVIITRIEDRSGNIIYDSKDGAEGRKHKAVSETSAFLMTNMMNGVVQSGTAQRIKAIGRPVGGKTGTSNDSMDAWFIGYTPDWVCGVWVGFDQKRSLGKMETGGRAAAPIWLYAMEPFLKRQDVLREERMKEEDLTNVAVDSTPIPVEVSAEVEMANEEEAVEEVPPRDPNEFEVPAGVQSYWVNKATGVLAEPGEEGAILEYFKDGNGPNATSGEFGNSSTLEYLESPDL